MARVLSVGLLCALAACGGGSGGVVPTPFGPIVLTCGFELLQSTGVADMNLPEDFFGPGSDPFIGMVTLMGEPLGPRGPFEPGTTDTIVERLDDVNLPANPSQDQIPIELVELRLVSVQPITVTFNGGMNPELWDVDIQVVPETKNRGQITIERDSDAGGTFQGLLEIRPTITFNAQASSGTQMIPGLAEGLVTGDWDATPDPLFEAFRRGVAPLTPGHVRQLGFDSPLLDFTCGRANTLPGAPGPAFVDPTAVVAPDVGSLGRGCTIGAGAVVGPGAIIGPGATIGPGCMIGEGACVGDGCNLGANGQLGAFAAMGADGIADPGLVVGPNTLLGDLCELGMNAQIGADCAFGDFLSMAPGASIGDACQGGSFVILGAGATVASGLRLAGPVELAPMANITEHHVRCVDVNGLETTGPLSQCGDPILQQFVRGFVPGFYNPTNGIEPPGQSVTPVNPGALPADLQDLANDVGTDIAPPNNGGTGMPYVLPAHDCDDFAEELRVKLAGKGYSTTFTVIYDVNPNRKWWHFWKPKLINGHCLTDVHRANGDTIWLEPQFTGAAAVGIDVDDDNDGMVTYATGPGTDATDGGKRIEVYDSAQAAENAGRDLD